MIDEQDPRLNAIVADSYPRLIPTTSQRSRATWVMETSHAPDDAERLMLLAQQAEKAACAAILFQLPDDATAERAALIGPRVELVRISPGRLAVVLELGTGDGRVGDSDMISHWCVLNELDSILEFHALQGLPREFWFPLRRKHPHAPIDGGGS